MTVNMRIASAELDALIAEKVMRWTRGFPFWCKDTNDTEWWVEVSNDLYSCNQSCQLWDPSSQWKPAFAVVEALIAANPLWDVSVGWHQGVDTSFGQPGWVCEIIAWDDTRSVPIALSGVQETGPLAICVAAFKAVTAKVAA